MSINFHSKNSVEFTTRGYAQNGSFTGVYPVINLEARDKEGCTSNDVTLFMNVEQLYELRKSITTAIRDVHKMKVELARTENLFK
jgi:hypothetical protein